MTEHANKILQLPIMRRDSLIDPVSFNVADRSFDIRWTTGARRITWSYDEGNWGGFVEEELDLAGADLSRLNNGAPYFKDHGSWSIDNQLGVHVDGSAIVDLQLKEGRARIRLSKNAWVDRYWNDIADKILRQTSVGYQVGTYLVIREEGRLPLYRATQWTPLENSQVGLGADPGAQVRSAGSEPPKLFATNIQYHNRTIISIPKELPTMSNKNNPAPKIPNQSKKRAMGDDIKTKVSDILKEYGVADDKLAEATDKIAALWPEETASGSGTQSADLAAIGKALGAKDGATAKEIAVAATNLRALCDGYSNQLDETEESNTANEFDDNEKKGLHRKLDLAGDNFARDLFQSNPELYRAEVAKVKPLNAKPPAAKAETRKTIEDHAAEEDALEGKLKARAAEMRKEDPKLSDADAYQKAFREWQDKRNNAKK